MGRLRDNMLRAQRIRFGAGFDESKVKRDEGRFAPKEGAGAEGDEESASRPSADDHALVIGRHLADIANGFDGVTASDTDGEIVFVWSPKDRESLDAAWSAVVGEMGEIGRRATQKKSGRVRSIRDDRGFDTGEKRAAITIGLTDDEKHDKDMGFWATDGRREQIIQDKSNG